MSIIKKLKKNLVFKKLLYYGMFSEKITEMFSSKTFGKWIHSNGLTKYKKRSFSTVTFHLTRNNNAPRIIEIPHPIAYYRLCNEIKINWVHIVKTIGEIEDYSDRSKELERFHLRLNPKKTKITVLPAGLDQDWVRELRAYSNKFLAAKQLTRKKVTTVSEFIDLAIALSDNNPGDSPIRYAVKVLSRKKFMDDEVMAFTIMYLSRVCYIYPYFIDLFNDILKRNKPNKKIKSLLSKEINSIMNEHIEYSRSDVALWGIYLAMKYKFKIKEYDRYSNKLIEGRDCLPVLLSYEYAKKKKHHTKKYFDLVKELIKEKNEDEWWVYIYQLYRDSPRKQSLKKIAYKDFYEDMRKGKVTFLDL